MRTPRPLSGEGVWLFRSDALDAPILATSTARGLALAFGVRWPSVIGQPRVALGAPYADLLDRAASRAIIQKQTMPLLVIPSWQCMSHNWRSWAIGWPSLAESGS